MENSSQKLGHGLRELTMASIITKPLGVVNATILFSCLSIHEFGLFALAQSLFSLVNFISGFAQGELVVSRFAKIKEQGQEEACANLFRSFLVLGVLGVFCTTSIAIIVVHWVVGGQKLTFMLLVAGACVAFLSPCRNFVLVFFQARENFKSIKVLELSCRISLTLGYSLFVFGFGFGLLGVFVSNIIANLIPLIVGGASFFLETIRAVRHPKLEPIFSLIKGEGKWLLARWGIATGHGSGRPWLILSILGTEAVALFEAAKTVLGICKDVVPLKKVLLPLMSRAVIHESRIKKLFQQASCYSAWLYAGAGTLILFSAPLVFTVLFPKYQEAINIIQLMTMNLILLGFAAPQASIFFALDRQKFYFDTALLSFSFMFLFSIPGMVLWGLNGLALAFVANNLVVSLTRYVYLSRQDARLQLSWKEFVKFDADDKKFFMGLLPGRIKVLG